MSYDSVPLFLSTPLLLSLKHGAKTTQTVGHVILALVRAKQSWESGATVTCMARTKKVAKRHISPFILLPKRLLNARRHPLLPCLTQISSIVDIRHQTNWGKLTDVCFSDGSCVSVSLWPACPPAGFGRPGWAGVWKWSLKLLPVWPWERVGKPTAGAAEHMRREGEGEQETKRSERGTAHSHSPPTFLPPPSGPLHCHPPLSKPPLLDPPGCKFLVCGPNTKNPNPSKSQAEQFTDSHTCPPPHFFQCPLLLVPQHTWFHLN